MASRVNRAEIWPLERRRTDRRRPVLVLSRPSLIAALHTVIVAAITSTRRGSPTEVGRQFVGTVSLDRMQAVCSALSIATACD